jgi:hypothetical protein
MSELDTKLKTLIDSEQELTKKAEALNQRFIGVASTLREFACATAMVRMPEATADAQPDPYEDGPSRDVAIYLAWRKDGKEYNLLLLTDCEEERDVIPITSATLKQRIEAAGLLPNLVWSLTLHTTGIIEQIDAALSA